MKLVPVCGGRLLEVSRILSPANHGFVRWRLQSIRGYSEGPLFGNHNNTFRTTTRQGAYGSTEVLNADLLSDSIPKVKLACVRGCDGAQLDVPASSTSDHPARAVWEPCQ